MKEQIPKAKKKKNKKKNEILNVENTNESVTEVNDLKNLLENDLKIVSHIREKNEDEDFPRFVETMMKEEEMREQFERGIDKDHKKRKGIIKKTTTVLLREARIVLKEEEKEQKKLLQLLEGSPAFLKCEQLLKIERQREKEMFKLKIEKLHSLGQLTYEKAQMAKKRFIDQCQSRRKLYEIERLKLKKELTLMKKDHERKIEELVQKGHEIDKRVKENKENLLWNKRLEANSLNEKIKEMIKISMKERKLELKYKIATIQQLRTLEAIRKGRNKIKKIEKPAEHGLLSEMSLEELKNRLRLAKAKLRIEISNRRMKNRRSIINRKNILKNVESYIKSVREYKKQLTDEMNKEELELFQTDKNSTKEINKKLQEIYDINEEIKNLKMKNKQYLKKKIPFSSFSTVNEQILETNKPEGLSEFSFHKLSDNERKISFKECEQENVDELRVLPSDFELNVPALREENEEIINKSYVPATHLLEVPFLSDRKLEKDAVNDFENKLISNRQSKPCTLIDVLLNK